jgi:predicted TPR repeat methyltransferase
MLEKILKKRKCPYHWCRNNVRNRFALIVPSSVCFYHTRSLEQSKPDWRWQLTASGRFAHRKEYVQSVGEAHSLKLVHYEPMVDFRYENGVGVQGHIFVMQKQTSDSDQEL